MGKVIKTGKAKESVTGRRKKEIHRGNARIGMKIK